MYGGVWGVSGDSVCIVDVTIKTLSSSSLHPSLVSEE